MWFRMPAVQAMAHLPAISDRWGYVEFLVDTGAAITVLHPRDVQRVFRIEAARLRTSDAWPRSDRSLGSAGPTVNYIARGLIVFRHDDGVIQTIEQDIRIAQMTDHNATLPSVLGWDVLRHFHVCADRRTGVVRLDAEPLAG